MALALEHAAGDRERVTAGLPSLSSQKRRDITEQQLKHIYQKACQGEYNRNEANALASDGAIDDVTDWEQTVGIPLVGARIINRLRKLNSNLWFEPSNADHTKTGVYVLKNVMGVSVKQYICGMETDLNPEFSVRITDDEGRAKGIIGGWRRVLMRLIRDRIISKYAAETMFGPPSRGSENWARFTQ
jgi:hypothetical protein